MGYTCHRCDGDLPGDELRGFCPACGAPQLRVFAMNDEDGAATESSRALPPPRPRQIVWPVALRCGAEVAAVTAVCVAGASRVGILGLPSLLLIFGASFIAVNFYRRRSPAAMMTPSIGARIGLSTGLLLAAGLLMTLTLLLLAARFRTHTMGGFDAEWTRQLHDLLERTRASSPVPPDAERQMMTPEFRAGSMLAGLSIFASFLLVISTGSGAFAGSLAARPRSRE